LLHATLCGTPEGWPKSDLDSRELSKFGKRGEIDAQGSEGNNSFTKAKKTSTGDGYENAH
jgi:hypothetical protein